MKDTAFSVGGESAGRLATAYERDNATTGEPVVHDAPDGFWSRPPVFQSGGGGLVSTADDYSPSPPPCSPAVSTGASACSRGRR